MLDAPLIQIVATWGMLGAACFGLGAGILWAAGVSRPTGNAVVTIVIGWAALMAANQITRFFMATAPWMLVVAGAAAVPGWIRAWRTTGLTRLDAASGLTWLAAGVWYAALSLRAVPNYDTGLYHYDVVRWTQAYPLVPGLANVHDRLGFNSTIFAFAAMVDHAPFGLAAHVVLNGFFAWLWAGWVAIEGLRGPTRERTGITRVFAIASLPVLVEWATGNQLPSLGPEIAIACFFLIVTGECLRVMPAGVSLGERETALAIVVWIAAAATSVKLSALGLLSGVCVLFVAHTLAIRRGRGRAISPDPSRPIWVLGGLAVVNVAAWLGGNVILSGYPVYPSLLGGLPVGWRVPPQTAEAAGIWVRSWARMPNEPFYDYLAGAPSLVHWWTNARLLLVSEIVGAAILSATAVFLGWRAQHRLPWSMVAALVPIGASLAYWFGTAPDPRFSGNGATVALAGAIALLATVLRRAWLGVVVAGIAAVVTALPHVWMHPQKLVAEREFWRKDPAALPTVEFDEKITESGLRIAVPARDGQSSWGQRLPASYQFNPKLALRDPPQVRRGFYVTDPTSLPIGWPWPKYGPASIDDRTYGTFIRGGGGVDGTNPYVWFQLPVRMIVYSSEPRAARLRFKVAHVVARDAPPSAISVFADGRKAGEFSLAEQVAVDLTFTLQRGFNEILFVENWGQRDYEFAAVKAPAGTIFASADYQFTDAAK